MNKRSSIGLNFAILIFVWSTLHSTAPAQDQVATSDSLARMKLSELPGSLPPFEYVDVGPKIPNYVRSKQWGTQEAPRNLMQKPLSPADSIQHYTTLEGFRLELFVAEPHLGGKPICMNWDHRGRLWVAETYDYPNEIQPPGKGRDRIRICEDTNGDGQADKFTVFAERLSIPTSIAFSHDGVIVHQAPDTLFLKDTDGDDVADVRQVLFSGWNTNDTHAGPSNLNYGLDNWFYGIVGYSGFNGEIAGKKRNFRTGFYRFRVDLLGEKVAVTDFEFLRNTNNNSWGVGISESGLLFGSTANRNPSEFMPIANRFYEMVHGWSPAVLSGIADTHLFQPITEKIRQVDHHDGYTAAAGHALYTARRYPPAFWNRTAFVAGPTGHLVGIFQLTADGAGFRSTSPLNLIASDDEWAAPIMAEVGPDGNVWVIDWYNYIVQHNPTPSGFENGPGNAYRTDLRDKTHGRIYRVVYGDEPPNEPRSLANAGTKQLVEALTSSNMFWRRHAQRMLIEQQDQNAIPLLIDLLRREKVDAIGLDVGAIHALQTLFSLSAFRSEQHRDVFADALNHTSSSVVRNAVQLTPHVSFGHSVLTNSKAFASPDPQVRLAALLAIAQMPPSPEAAQQAILALADPRNRSDRWMIDAAICAAANDSTQFLVNACRQEPASGPLLKAVEIIARHQAKMEPVMVRTIIPTLQGAPQQVVQSLLNGWSEGWPKRQTIELEAAVDQQLAEVLGALQPQSQAKLIRLARSWGSARVAASEESIIDALWEIVEDDSAAADQRVLVAVELIELSPNDLSAAKQVLDAISPLTPVAAASGMMDALRGSRANGVGELMVKYMNRFTPATRSRLLQVMLTRGQTTFALIEAIDAGELMQSDLSLDQQQSLLQHPNKKIRTRAAEVMAESGATPNPDRQGVLAELLPLTNASGDQERGKAVYVKNCANCHTHNDLGKKVGPDLTGMHVHPKAELLTHIIDPSRSVEGNYRSYAVLTADGVVINGMLASETQTSIEIIDTQGERRVVQREDIDRLSASRKSIMPDGFEKQIDQQGLIDLLEFLTTARK